MLSFHHGICGVFNLLDFLVIGLAASSYWNFEHQTCFPCTLTYTARGGSKKKKKKQDKTISATMVFYPPSWVPKPGKYPSHSTPPLNHSGI